jgi:anaerobic ribonucleoside-triphosphate reductase
MEIQNFFCHDCNKEIEVDAAGEIKNGNLLKYKLADGKEKMVFKCSECYANDPSLRNFQETEVYSRVVGYIRPVSQWNEGKQHEFMERKTFNV